MLVRCVAVRVIRDGFPAFVDARLTDASGFEWQLVDKTPIFAEMDALEDPAVALPMAVSLPCRVIAEDPATSTAKITVPDVSDRVFRVPRDLLIED